MENEGLYNRCYLIEFKEGDNALYRTPLFYQGSINDKYHVVGVDDTLHSIAQKYYDSQFSWFIIADANASLIDDIFSLTVGISLVIPNLGVFYSAYVKS